MKNKILQFLSAVVLLLAMSSAFTQNECRISLSADFSPTCILTEYGKEIHPITEDEDCLVACKDNSVTYTVNANCTVIDYVWNVSGASAYDIAADGQSATIHWGTTDVGAITVVAVLSDSVSQSFTQCIVLMDVPTPSTQTVPNYYIDGFGAKRIEVCLGETVHFMDNSDCNGVPITGHYWRSAFGVGSLQNFTVTPTQSGTDTIVHYVINECGCETAEKFLVDVMPSTTIEFDCYGTACAGSSATYSVPQGTCSDYRWYVDGGNIVAGQGTNKITVLWGNPLDGYGTVALDAAPCSGSCNSLYTVKIPIIGDSVAVNGPEEVCVGDYQIYELPLWGSTYYHWAIPSPPSTSYSNYEHLSQCMVNFLQPGVVTIHATYNCTFLDCGPCHSATKVVTVRDTLSIVTSDVDLCENATGAYTTANSEIVLWRVYDQDHNLVDSVQSSALYYTFLTSGTYRIEAVHPDYCNTAVQIVTVHSAPPAITTVDGPSEVCQGKSALFSATVTQQGCYLRWEPNSASIFPQSVEGDDATFFFGTEIAVISVYQIDGRYGCRSQAYIHPVDTFRLRPLGITAPIEVCAGQTVHIGIPDQSDNVLYEWTIGPTFAASVIGDHTSPSINVITNYTSLPLPITAVATVKRKYCGAESYDGVQITIVGATSPTLEYDTVVCQGELVRFSVQGQSEPQLCRWEFGNTVENGTEVFHSFGTTGTHHFTLFYSEDMSCAILQLQGSVTVLPHPHAYIVPAGDTLTVVSSDSLTYQWLRDGIPTGDTTASIIVGDDANYCCIVTSVSAPYCSTTVCHFQQELCDTLTLSVDTVVCNTAAVHVVGTPPAEVHWSVSPHPYGTYCSPATSAGATTFHASVAGTFTIIAAAREGSQCYSGYCHVTIPCVLNFSAESDCNGHVVLTDQSSYISGMTHPARTFTVLGHSGYSVVMPSSSSTASLSVAGLPAGSYIVEMSATINGHTCTFAKEVYIGTRPTIAQMDVPTTVCEKTPFECSAVVSSDAALCRWDFGDGSYNFGNNIFHTYGVNNIYTITLIASNASGCSSTMSQQVSVVQNLLEGAITSNSTTVCPGSPKQIVYVHSIPLLTFCTYIWQNSTPTNNNFYNTYQTGNYRVRVLDQFGCKYESMANVGFLNAPTAHITGEAQFCYGQQVEFFGNSGEGNTYSWSVSDDSFPTTQSAYPNIAYLSTSSGNHSAQLTVTNAYGCTATDTYGFTVRPQLPAPVLEFVASHSCISNPPVHITSPTNPSLFWSNGYNGAEARYYNSGFISAYYLSADSVCRSESANFFIPPAPNYDALLTGCYEKCLSFFPTTLPLYMLLPTGPIHWEWFRNQALIQQGNTIGATLNLPGLGSYYLDAQYGDSCSSQSPTLNIVRQNSCPCDVEVVSEAQCYSKGCGLAVNVTATLYNHSSSAVSFDGITSVSNMQIATPSSLSLTVPSHGSTTFNFTFIYTGFPDTIVTFRLNPTQKCG